MKINFTVKQRLLGLLGAFVLASGTLIVCMVVLNDSIQSISGTRHELGELQTKVLELRKHEKDYLARELTNPEYFKERKSKYVSKFKQSAREVDSIINLLENNKYVIDAEAHEFFDSLTLLFTSYKHSFLKLEELSFARGFKDWGIEGKLRDEIHHLEGRMNSIRNNSAFMVQMLTLRRNEKDYFLRKDVKYIQNFTTNLALLQSNISKSNISIKDSLISDLNHYKKAMEEYLEVDKQIGLNEKMGVMGEMRNAIQVADPIISKVIVSLESLLEVRKTRMVMWVFAIAALGVVAALLLSMSTMRYIYRQIGGEPKDVAELASEIAEGNLEVNLNKTNIQGILLSVVEMAKKLKTTLEGIVNVSEDVSNSSNEFSLVAQQISTGASEQASGAEEISSSMEEMAANVDSNSEKVQQASVIAGQVSITIDKVNGYANKTYEAMENILNEITIVNEIAEKIDMLAINAAIEAARAGEYGKGFAVVANEVRKLAENSQRAAQKINEVSHSSLRVVQASTDSIRESQPEFKKLVTIVEEVAASVEEQQLGITQVNMAVQEFTNVTQQNATSSEELSAKAEELNSLSKELKDLISYFNKKKRSENTESLLEELRLLKKVLHEKDIDYSFEAFK